MRRPVACNSTTSSGMYEVTKYELQRNETTETKMATVRELSLEVGNVWCPVVTLLDRRGRAKTRAFLLVRSLELLLWPNEEREWHTHTPNAPTPAGRCVY